MQVENTLIKESTLVSFLSHFYNLDEPISCQFIRRSFNDHYLVKSGAKHYILRVYLNNKSYIRCINDIHFELDFLDYLYSQKLPVIPPISNRDNQNLCLLELDNESRCLVLFPYAKGSPIDSNLNNNQSINLGKSIANLHLSSNHFQSHHSRYCLTIQNLIEEPLHIIEKYTYSYGLGKLSFFNSHSRSLINNLNKIPIDDKTYGIIHGDPNPSNFFFSNDDGFSLFDFDHCAFGYRIHDLAVIKLSFPEKVYKGVLKGYESTRPLQDVERSGIEMYSNILLIKKFSDIYNMLEITESDESEKYLVTQNAYNTLNVIAGHTY